MQCFYLFFQTSKKNENGDDEFSTMTESDSEFKTMTSEDSMFDQIQPNGAAVNKGPM